MRLIEIIGHALKSFHSDPDKLIAAQTATHVKSGASLDVSSPAFSDGQEMAQMYTTDGGNNFPGLQWSGAPPETKCFLLVLEDPDAPKPTPFVHAIVYNIPADSNELPSSAFVKGTLSKESYATGIRCGANTLRKDAYMGPAPPRGHGPHYYYFQMFALSKVLSFAKTPTLDDIKKAIEESVLAVGETVGVYQRGN